MLANITPKLQTHFANIAAAPDASQYDSVILMDVPSTFEGLSQVVASLPERAKLVLFLFRCNRDYLKMARKKLNLEFKELTFNANKLMLVEEKLQKMVDSNYAINRQAFYAYGSFLKHFNANLLKRIFRTDRLNMKGVGLGFGMPVPPKVNMDAKFLTQKAQLREKADTKKAKLQKLREAQKAQEEPESAGEAPPAPVIEGVARRREGAASTRKGALQTGKGVVRTKKIAKTKTKTSKA